MKFSVTIPVFNSGPKISRTIDSILAQTAILDGSCSFTCVVVDGASTDDTLDHVRKFDDPRITIIQEPDQGMYDALSKGLTRATGDVTCYLAAGEQFDPHAFSIVSDIFTKFPQVGWLTGRAVARNEKGQVIESLLHHPFKRAFIDCGIYGTQMTCIQQESTFWRTSLNSAFDYDALRKLKLAGDYFLWRSLARDNEIYVVNSQLAAFTVETGQLSRLVPGAYRKELKTVRRNPTVMERLQALVYRKYTKYRFPRRSAKRLIYFDVDLEDWKLTNE